MLVCLLTCANESVLQVEENTRFVMSAKGSLQERAQSVTLSATIEPARALPVEMLA